MRPLSAITLFITIVSSALAQPAHPYVGYDIFETRRSESDHRECLTQIFLTGDDFVGYRYREDVFGSTTPTVHSIDFSNEYSRKATPAEQAELVQALLAANVFDLAKEEKPDSTEYFSSLDVRLNKREGKFVFYSPPVSPSRKAIHDVILQFAKQMEIDRPKDQANAITVTEGDCQPAREVTLAELLAHPEKYHGKRVSVVGYYHGEFEGSSFSIDEDASLKRDYKRSVWRGEVSTFAEHKAINDQNDSWLQIEGVFLRGPGGHMGLWPGELVRITRIEPTSKRN